MAILFLKSDSWCVVPLLNSVGAAVGTWAVARKMKFFVFPFPEKVFVL